jgi:hypothetical protein
MEFFTDSWERLHDLWVMIVFYLQDIAATHSLPVLLQDVPEHDLIVITSTVFAIACLNVGYLLFKPGRRRAKMTKEERKLYERRLISDAITDAIEDKVYRDEISRNTATHWYFLIGHRCGLVDLLPKPPQKPKPPPAEELKVVIRERLVNLWKTKKALPVPVEKPVPEKVLKFERRPLKSA